MDIQQEVRERLGVIPVHVVMLSDEEDPVWWDSIRAEGWYTTIDIAKDAADKYGTW